MGQMGKCKIILLWYHQWNPPRISPQSSLFSVYIDDLLIALSQMGVGCHISDKFIGAAGFADDIILIAPSSRTMEIMLEQCESYANQNNLKFSTDINPSKSKSKCIYMCGKMNNVVYPAPFQLYGVDLPWVTHATHLGHKLHQDCTMEYDAKTKRGNFIGTSTDIRDMIGFANPIQVLQAVSVYSAHFYGSMLWNLYGEMAGQVFRAWNTCVKLAWSLPRWTHNYFVDELAGKLPSVRKKIFGQYVRFFQKLLLSTSPEISMMANIVGRDMGSVTGNNLHNLETEFGVDPWQCSPEQLKQVYKLYEVPDVEKWRLPLLEKLLDQKFEMKNCGENTRTICALIDSLCTT